MPRPKRQPRPKCVFCGRSGPDVYFQIFSARRFEPFGTACVDCERDLPPETVLPPFRLTPEED